MKQLIHKTSKTIKKSLLILFFATMALTGFAQVAINADGSSPDASAMLDVKSSNKGLLIPRLTEAERNAISSPATGLMIFQTNNTTGFYYYDGSNWEVIGSGAFSIDDLLDGKAGGNSVFLGDSAGTNDDGTDNYNTAVGYNALQTNTGARYNVAFGGSALKYSTGGSNTACGTGSSIYNTTGSFNTSVGRNALFHNTTGEGNTGLGSNANYYNEEGSYNTMVGFDAGNGVSNHNKSGNIFLGYQAGYHETGDNKLYIENSNSATPLIYGEFDNDLLRINGTLDVNNAYQFPTSDGSSGQVLKSDGSGTLSWQNDNDNVGVTQIDDLSDGKTGGNSVFLGHNAGINEDGNDRKNVAIGRAALWSDTSGYQNVAVGYSTLYKNKSGHYNTAVGAFAMLDNTIGTYNTSTGYSSLILNIEGNGNTANGVYALRQNTTGNENTAMGASASRENSIGSNNVAIGAGANKNNEEGSNNTIIGHDAGAGTALHNKSGNVFLGYSAGFDETGDNRLYIENSNSTTPLVYGEFDNDILTVNGKLGIGTSAPDVQLHVVGGSDASLAGGGYIVSGPISGQNIVMDENELMARNNGAISSLHLQRDGGAFNLHYDNTETNQFMVASSGKTGIGVNSPLAKLHINTASGEDGMRVQIESFTKLKVASNGGVSVGYNATTPTFALQLQNSSVDLKGRARAYSWTTYSDGRLKTDQKTLDYGLNEVMQLQPKSYFHHDSETKEDGTFVMIGAHKTHTFGFIAQELNKVIPEAVYVPEDETKDLWSIDYEKLIPVLTKAIQEQQQTIEKLQQENRELKARLDRLGKMIENN